MIYQNGMIKIDNYIKIIILKTKINIANKGMIKSKVKNTPKLNKKYIKKCMIINNLFILQTQKMNKRSQFQNSNSSTSRNTKDKKFKLKHMTIRMNIVKFLTILWKKRKSRYSRRDKNSMNRKAKSRTNSTNYDKTRYRCIKALQMVKLIKAVEAYTKIELKK